MKNLYFDIDGYHYEIPAKHVVCSYCLGEGVSNGHPCPECNGARVELVPDYEMLNEDQREAWEKFREKTWDALQVELMDQRMKDEN